MSLRLITAPSGLPVRLDEARLQARLDTTDDDPLLEIYLQQLVEAAQHRTGRALITQTWELVLDAFPACEILVPLPPLQAVISIKYDDSAGNEQTLSAADYKVDTASVPGRIVPAYGKSWPATLAQIAVVRVRFTAGYGAAETVPAGIRHWMLARLATYAACREQLAERQTLELPRDYTDGLLDPYRIYAI